MMKKNKEENKTENFGEGAVNRVNGVVKKRLKEKMMPKEGVHAANIWGKSIVGSRSSKHKGCEKEAGIFEEGL